MHFLLARWKVALQSLPSPCSHLARPRSSGAACNFCLMELWSVLAAHSSYYRRTSFRYWFCAFWSICAFRSEAYFFVLSQLTLLLFALPSNQTGKDQARDDNRCKLHGISLSVFSRFDFNITYIVRIVLFRVPYFWNSLQGAKNKGRWGPRDAGFGEYNAVRVRGRSLLWLEPP